MSKRHWLPAILFAWVASAGPVTAQPSPPTQAEAQAMIGSPVGLSEFVWRLFVQATRPAGDVLTFETWTEQCQLTPQMAGCPGASATAVAGDRGVGHASPLARAIRRREGKAQDVEITQNGVECNGMQTTPNAGYPPPSNVVSTAQFCEQVFVNPQEQAFIAQNKLATLTGQQTYGAANGGAVTFPWDAIEVKADWVPTSSYSGPVFSCPDANLFTKMYKGTCYALVGLHISSKVLPDWVWATFEPASSITNPNRCDPKLYSTCFDPWGTTSSAPYGKGTVVPQSAQLQQLMKAGGIDPVFKNYYLTGAQTQFVDGNGQAIPLGSSFVEFNAGVAPGQASCITCHKYAYFDGKNPGSGNPEDNFGGAPTGWPNVGYACNKNQTGNCTPVAPNSTAQDFSWMLGLMPYQ